ncbi:hypothetical protein E8E11_001785 [Didymella keratinophila]|nr:hypothetical protein E8E11_001785 [Didymella keratinophila]
MKRLRTDGDRSGGVKKRKANGMLGDAVDLTTQNSLQSPLLRPPAELRNKIWKFTYQDQELLILQSYVTERVEYDLGDGEIPRLVSKQFWAEASKVFLDTCTLVFHDPLLCHLSQPATLLSSPGSAGYASKQL